MDETIINQILDIRDTGLTNMFDTDAVKMIADGFGYMELVAFIDEYPKDYFDTILHGAR